MKGRNGSTSFLPLKRKGGFQRKIPSEQCLTKEQTKQIYNKVELGGEVKIRNWFSIILLSDQSRRCLQMM